MARYASGTEVPVIKSRMEIETILTRYGAARFAYMSDEKGAAIAFVAHGRQIRFVLPLPDRNAKTFTHSSRGVRSIDTAQAAWEQACRQRWRALALVIKAKLEAVECGITNFETEFLPHTVLPDGRTAAEFMEPQVANAYLTGYMPNALMLEGPKP